MATERPAHRRRRRWGLHAAGWLVGVGLFRTVLVPAETCEHPDRAEVDAAIELTVGWAEANLGPGGEYTYGWWADRDVFSGSYNLVRHAGMVLALYQAAAAGHPDALATAEPGLDYMLARLVDTGAGTAFALPGQPAKIGAAGLLIAALHHRRLATGDPTHDELSRRLGRFLVAQQEPRGSILAFWDPATGRPEPDRYSAFGSGEAFWALALLERDFPGEGWGEAASAAGRYIATGRRAHEDLLLRLPDHWAAYGFAELAAGADTDAFTEIDEADEYLRRLAGDFGLMTRFESTRPAAGLSRLVRGDHALGAGVGALGEGLGAMWRLAATDGALADHRSDLAERLGCVGGLLVDRQIDAAEASEYARPAVARGAWFRQGYTQIDDQQHTLSALVALAEVMDAGGDR